MRGTEYSELCFNGPCVNNHDWSVRLLLNFWVQYLYSSDLFNMELKPRCSQLSAFAGLLK